MVATCFSHLQKDCYAEIEELGKITGDSLNITLYTSISVTLVGYLGIYNFSRSVSFSGIDQ
jgi:hypothetical protein